MENIIEKYPHKVQRFIEIAIGLTTWAIITLPLWLSPFHPAIVAYFILLFDIYFFYKSSTTAYYSLISLLKLVSHQKIDWQKKAKKVPGYKKLNHLIIIPNYKEPLNTLTQTLDSLKDQTFPTKKLYIVLGMEAREKDVQNKAQKLINKYQHYFAHLSASYHVLSENEVAGKASCQSSAAKQITKHLIQKGHNIKNFTITTADADSIFPKKYFSYLTLLFLSDKERFYHFYSAPFLLYRNYWQLPLLVRVKTTLDNIIRLANLARPDKLIQVSTYSASLQLVKNINFWDINIIPEDWHIFFQAYFKYGSKVKTTPIFLPVLGDAAFSIADRYEQEKRWAWGVTDIPYAIKKYFTSPHIPFLPKTVRLFRLVEAHIFWPSNFFLLTLAASIPPLVNPAFERTALGHTLPQLSGFIITVSTVFVVILIYVDSKTRPQREKGFKTWQTPTLLLQWITLPLVSFILSSLPSLDAHTRLMLGKKLEYKVTKKK